MFIKHIGTSTSGRYKKGSGEDPKRNLSFRTQVKELEKKGMSPVDIAKALGMNTKTLREKVSIEKDEVRIARSAQAEKLKAKGYSNVAGGKIMGISESSFRGLLNKSIKERSEITNTTANILKESVANKKYIDVGLGVERHMNISRTKLKTAIGKLEEEGYKVYKFDVEQLGTGKQTKMMVLTKDDVTYKELMQNKDKIRMTTDYSEDGGKTYDTIQPPKSISSTRVNIRYTEDGGSDKDGVIELRRGLSDISLGNAKYAQVRIAVDGTHYMKGMAIHSDDMPKGVDVIYNSNKNKTTPKEKVFKEMKEDPDNPFGATIRQKHYVDTNGKKQLSSLNIVNEEGEWRDKWSKSLSSQMLSKQTPQLAKEQLELTFKIKKEQYEERLSLTNPVIKKKMLEAFADDADSSAVHLKAAALPRSSWHVIMPVPSMKETEVYAPNYRDGEKVVLIRYPHGGIFEIPELVVNNKNVGKKVLDGAKDAIGIHPKVAEKLSGADFDGDAVLVIPNKGTIKTSASLKGLLDFDPKSLYKAYDGMKTIDGGIYNTETGKADYGNKKPSGRAKGMQMGLVSNLITDMTIKGADPKGDEITRAIKHSMVVIDSEKHHLDYKRSYIENRIAELNAKYQGKKSGGASTLISRASGKVDVGLRKEKIDPITGKKVYEYSNDSYTNKKGKLILKTTKSTKMVETDDAFKLSSGTPMESIYATHANRLKALANDARKTAINIKLESASTSARGIYNVEVSSLKAKLDIALMNKPLERQAHLVANSVINTRKANNPNMDPADLKKLKGQQLAIARIRTGASKQDIEITDREWEAIQSRAISPSLLTLIINNTNLDRLTKLATPRTTLTLTTVKQTKAKAMANKGYTQSEIADALGVSISSIAKILG